MKPTGNTEGMKFATRLGVLAATVGSAVGLGNIWRFPYEAGTHGGGAFLLVYILFVLILGVPVICAEFVIGRYTGKNAVGAFRQLGGKRWPAVGFLGILAAFLILGFYPVVAGWTIEYFIRAVCGQLTTHDPASLHAGFESFTSGWMPVVWTLIFLVVNYVIIGRGVQKGIERISNILMPLLFVILVAFAINSLLLPGAGEGLTFLFKPDFSQLTASAVIGAMGQAFFSLSVGMGVLMTYASYFSKDTPLANTAVTTASLDTLVAVLAGVIIFPAVFSFGQTPAAGPPLVFEVLPSIFSQMPAGALWAALFFLLLFVASLTSTISLSEVVVAYLIQERGMSRRNAILVQASGVAVLAVLSALSFGPLKDWHIFGRNFFDFLDFVTASIMMPLGGMLTAIFAGWRLKKGVLETELLSGEAKERVLVKCIAFCLCYIAPAAILIIFIYGLV